MCGAVARGGEFTGHACVPQKLPLSGPKMELILPQERFFLRWLGAHFLCAVLLLTIDFLCARVGGTFG